MFTRDLIRRLNGQEMDKYFFPDYPAAMNLTGSPLASNWGATLASATQIIITSAFHKVTGTVSCTSVKIPTGFRGMFILVPAAAFPVATGGVYVASDGVNEVIPWANAQTCAANEPLICVTDGLLVYAAVSA